MSDILQMKNITKIFPGVKALDNVQFDLKRGEVHALIGENGAGKSTLMKVLMGIHTPDSGSITFKGKDFSAANPKDAQDKGISIIHQEFNLLPDLTVAENIFIAREPRKYQNMVIDDRTMILESRKLMESLELNIDVNIRVADLSVAEKQMVEIAKALVVESDILVLDEPTSALAENEVQKLFKIIKRLRSAGVGIVYISHRLEEFHSIVDRVTVLRDGCYISTHQWADITIPQLIAIMVGRDLVDQYPSREAKIGDIIFEARNINRGYKLKNASISVKSGEIVGLTGLMGAGRSELARAIFGADKIDSGEFWIEGKRTSINTTIDAIKNQIAYLPEDRKKDGLFLELEVYTNILSANINAYANKGVIDEGKCEKIVDEKIKELDIRTPSPRQIVKYLSGGNQQKVLVGRWLCRDSKVVIFDEPTRGIDVGAKYEIYNLMNRLVEEGVAIIMISSEMPEILGMSDRIVVMHEGKVMGELPAKEATQEKILHMASGLSI